MTTASYENCIDNVHVREGFVLEILCYLSGGSMNEYIHTAAKVSAKVLAGSEMRFLPLQLIAGSVSNFLRIPRG